MHLFFPPPFTSGYAKASPDYVPIRRSFSEGGYGGGAERSEAEGAAIESS